MVYRHAYKQPFNNLQHLDHHYGAVPEGHDNILYFNQLIIIGAAIFLGASVYWSIIVYYTYLLQENEVLIQTHFTQLTGSGTSHLENAKKLINKLLQDVKASENRLKIQKFMRSASNWHGCSTSERALITGMPAFIESVLIV